MKNKIRDFDVYTIVVTLMFVIWTVNTTCAQQIDIIGHVADKTSGEPLPYAQLVVHSSQDSSILVAGYSDIDGNFKIVAPTNFNVNLVITFMGYETHTQVFEWSQRPKTRGLNIRMVPNAEILKTIEISEEVNHGIQKIDRTVHIINKETIKNAKDIYDILKTLPGVVVDDAGAQKTIRFRGESPEMLIHNLSADIIYPKLDMIDIANINTIELIDKSALQGGEGQGGLINITFKKEKSKTMGAYVSNETGYSPQDKRISIQDNLVNANVLTKYFIAFNNFNYKLKKELFESNSEGNSILEDIRYRQTYDRVNDNKINALSNTIGLYLPSDAFSFLVAYQYDKM